MAQLKYLYYLLVSIIIISDIALRLQYGFSFIYVRIQDLYLNSTWLKCDSKITFNQEHGQKSRGGAL